MSTNQNVPTWTYGQTTNIDELHLDLKNPRFRLVGEVSEADAINLLVNKHGVVDLAKGLAANKGLLAGERIIVCPRANGGYVVLEGNRRVAALKILANPTLAPAQVRKTLLSLTEDAKQISREIPVDIADTRKTALPVIARRHTGKFIEAWSPLAQRRAIAGWIQDQSGNVKAVASESGMSLAEINSEYKKHNITTYMLDNLGWSMNELEAIEDAETLTTFDRFWENKVGQDYLGLAFEGTEPYTTSTRAWLHPVLKKIAQDIIINGEINSRDLLNSQLTKNYVEKLEAIFGKAVQDGKIHFFNGEEREIPTPPVKPPTPSSVKVGTASSALPTGNNPLPTPLFGEDTLPPSKEASNGSSTGPSGVKKKGPTPKASIFFEGLRCELSEQKLISLTKEIAKIDYNLFPHGAAFILRALIEYALLYTIRQKDKEKDFLAQIKGDMWTVKQILKYCGEMLTVFLRQTRSNTQTLLPHLCPQSI